jgi:hypothetical protein
VTTRDKLDGRVNELKTMSPLPGLFGVIGSLHVSHLPWSPNWSSANNFPDSWSHTFVTETPVLDVVRLIPASMLSSQTSPAEFVSRVKRRE